MQLSLSECRELRELLLNDPGDAPDNISLCSTPPSSPTPLLAAAAAVFDSPTTSNTQPLDPCVPNTGDLRAKSTVFPAASINKSAQIFQKLVSREILALPSPNITDPNLTKKQHISLQKLRAYENITIKEADKGGQVVVMDTTHYKTMCRDILDNGDWYRPISFAQLDGIVVKFYALVDSAREERIINDRVWKYIKTPSPEDFHVL